MLSLCLLSVGVYYFYSQRTANEVSYQMVPSSFVASGNALEADRLRSELEQITESYENILNIRIAYKEDEDGVYQIVATIKVKDSLSDEDEAAIEERFAECAGISTDNILIKYELFSETESK